MSDKKQKRVERRAQREALRTWRQHEPLTAEEYRLLDQITGAGAASRHCGAARPACASRIGDEFKADFRERCLHEVRRIHLLSASVNRGEKRNGRSS